MNRTTVIDLFAVSNTAITCCVCGSEDFNRWGIPFDSETGEIVANDFEGDWGSKPACERCFKLHESGRLPEVMMELSYSEQVAADHAHHTLRLQWLLSEEQPKFESGETVSPSHRHQMIEQSRYCLAHPEHACRSCHCDPPCTLGRQLPEVAK